MCRWFVSDPLVGRHVRLTTSSQVFQTREHVSIERQVRIEKQVDSHEKDDDLHRWMLKE